MTGTYRVGKGGRERGLRRCCFPTHITSSRDSSTTQIPLTGIHVLFGEIPHDYRQRVFLRNPVSRVARIERSEAAIHDPGVQDPWQTAS